jgi:pimeloyl-ACP methyl ester carboxylesterase
MPESYLHITGSGDAIHFYHANGFPAGVYKPFLDALNKEFDVFALQSRATQLNTPKPDHKDWNIYADDLIRFLEQQGKPIIAIGHSMGASSTILAAVKRPDLFKAVVLIEPAMVNLSTSMLLKLMPKKAIHCTKLVKGTASKPDSWGSKEEYGNYIKKFKGYRQFSKEAFDAFMDHGIQQVKDDYRLVFHKEWEAYNYTNPPYLLNDLKKLDQLNIPTVAIRGKPNLFFTNQLWQKWQAKQPNAIYLQNTQFSHLFPLEGPDACMELILEGLNKLGVIND